MSVPCSTTCASTVRARALRYATAMRWAVLLAGGSGTRFWPLSTPGIPSNCSRSPARPPAPRRRSNGSPASFPASGSWWSPGRRSPTGCRRGCSLPGRKHPGRASRRLHRPRAHLGHLGGPAPGSRCRGAVAPCRLGRRRRGRVPPHRRRRAGHGAGARPAGHRRAWCRRGPRPATATSCPARRSTATPAPWRASPKSRTRPRRSI